MVSCKWRSLYCTTINLGWLITVDPRENGIFGHNVRNLSYWTWGHQSKQSNILCRSLTMCGLFSEQELFINYDTNRCQASQPTGLVPEVAPGSTRGLQYWTPQGSLRRGIRSVLNVVRAWFWNKVGLSSKLPKKLEALKAHTATAKDITIHVMSLNWTGVG